MELKGGISVEHGERRTDQPFRVGVTLPDGIHTACTGRVWTNNLELAIALFRLPYGR